MKSVKKFFAVGFALIVAFTNIQFVKAEAAETETKTENTAEVADEKESTKPAIQMVSKVDVKYSADNPSLPVLNGYYFAGWYKTDKPEENPKVLNKDEVYTSTPEEGEEAWAKFVPEKVLTVVAQIPVTVKETQNPDGGKTPLRLVTTVDNLYYREVGFTITINGKSIPQEAKTVYKQLFAVGDAGELDTKTPETSFCDVSHYFAACTIDNIPKEAWNTEIQVVPYWITLDGTRVEGTSVVKEVEMGRDNQARIGNDWYWTLNYAIQQANKVTSGAPVVQVLRDIELEKGLEAITNSMTITTDGSGVDKKITTAVNSRIFHINGSGNEVTIKGTETERLILEGTGETASTQMLVYAQAGSKTTLEHVDFQDVNRSENNGGAINSAIKMELKDCSFTDCKNVGNSGAVFCQDDLILTDCSFTRCFSSSNNGGAIMVATKPLTLSMTNCTFDTCTAQLNGGAVRGNKIETTIEATNCDFLKCSSSNTTEAAANGGGAISSLGEVNLAQCTFDTCTAKYHGGAIYCGNILVAKNSIFNACTAKNGGAIYKAGTDMTGDLESCEFTENHTTVSGGAVYVNDSVTINIKDCKFNGNYTPKGGTGGAVYFYTGSSNLNLLGTCTFINNKAGGTLSNEIIRNAGGAILSPRNVNIGNGTDTAMVVMTGNQCTRADYGGAITAGTTDDTLAQFKILENANLYVYNNPTENANGADICLQNGGMLTIKEGSDRYHTSAPELSE